VEPGQHSNLTIVGSRNRPDKTVECFEQLKKVSHISDFLLLINEDQQDLYPNIDGVKRVVVPASWGTTSTAKVNYLVDQKLHAGYFTVSGIDDDCRVTTDGWDLLLSLPLKAKGYGISWGNDTIQNGRVPTKWTMTVNIIDALGFIAPPGLIHLFVDDFLARIGKELNSAHYAPNVMMEHHHWLNKKAEMDETYMESASRETWEHDERIWNEYSTGQFHEDLHRVKQALKLC
jgi:hypothetical protein